MKEKVIQAYYYQAFWTQGCREGIKSALKRMNQKTYIITIYFEVFLICDQRNDPYGLTLIFFLN